MHRKVRNSIKTALINRFYGIQTEINAYPIRMAHHANRQVQGFCYFPRKILAPEQRVISRKALAFKAFGVVQYALYSYHNDPSAETYIIFDADGNWSYYQRTPGDTEGTEMDCGILCYSVEEASTYYAESVMYDDMSYRVFDLDEDVLIWNDEHTYSRMDN